jgi:hypothetical protein
MHRSKVPLSKWLLASLLIYRHGHEITVQELMENVGIRSYKSAWLLSKKIRAAQANRTEFGNVEPLTVEREPLHYKALIRSK